jgi:hypothetical protein
MTVRANGTNIAFNGNMTYLECAKYLVKNICTFDTEKKLLLTYPYLVDNKVKDLVLPLVSSSLK